MSAPEPDYVTGAGVSLRIRDRFNEAVASYEPTDDVALVRGTTESRLVSQYAAEQIRAEEPRNRRPLQESLRRGRIQEREGTLALAYRSVPGFPQWHARRSLATEGAVVDCHSSIHDYIIDPGSAKG